MVKARLPYRNIRGQNISDLNIQYPVPTHTGTYITKQRRLKSPGVVLSIRVNSCHTSNLPIWQAHLPAFFGGTLDSFFRLLDRGRVN
jgi:hypothetical protein